MALLSFVDSTPRAYRLKASNAAPPISTFAGAIRLMNAKDINEVMQLQTEFLRNQFGVATEESKQMSGGIASAGGDVAKEEPDLI